MDFKQNASRENVGNVRDSSRVGGGMETNRSSCPRREAGRMSVSLPTVNLVNFSGLLPLLPISAARQDDLAGERAFAGRVPRFLCAYPASLLDGVSGKRLVA